MNVAATEAQTRQAAGHFDVLIVGAGISGIDAAHYLQNECPGRSFTLLETQESFGGTWLTHKYPGIRSDSDLFTKTGCLTKLYISLDDGFKYHLLEMLLHLLNYLIGKP